MSNGRWLLLEVCRVFSCLSWKTGGRKKKRRRRRRRWRNQVPTYYLAVIPSKGRDLQDMERMWSWFQGSWTDCQFHKVSEHCCQGKEKQICFLDNKLNKTIPKTFAGCYYQNLSKKISFTCGPQLSVLSHWTGPERQDAKIGRDASWRGYWGLH